jgi:polysaccharide export outer membrane protein
MIKRLLSIAGCVAVAVTALWLLAGNSWGQPPVAYSGGNSIGPSTWPATPAQGSPLAGTKGSDPFGLSAGPPHSAGPAGAYVKGPLHWAPFTANPPFAQGEYVERDRVVHTPSYRLRPDDLLELVYRVTRNETPGPYLIGVGDKLRIESQADAALNRDILTVLPDGTITLRMLGQIQAARRTVDDLRADLEQRYVKFYNEPGITVTPLEVNTKLEDLRQTVQSRFGGAGQTREARVTPEGTIQMPVIGSIFVQGLTLEEAKREIDERYAREIEGIEVMPVLVQRAPRFVYVVGEVRVPGRYSLEAPTTAMQAISMAGGWNVGANLHNVVVFRRDDNWQLMATRLSLWHPLYGNTPHACDDIFLGDTDVVVVPKMKILVADEFIELIFTRGIYGVVPFQGVTINMAKLSTL